MRSELRSNELGYTGGEGSKEVQDKLREIGTAFINHVSYIFERAVRRFSYSIELWRDYISFLQKANAIKKLNDIIGKVISLHPRNEEFWLLAAMHELVNNKNASTARVLLQRALRMNKKSKKLWIKYFELEVWYSKRTVERKRVLGIEV
jgi:U3 small nucleolar RNA-associated protein 6